MTRKIFSTKAKAQLHTKESHWRCRTCGVVAAWGPRGAHEQADGHSDHVQWDLLPESTAPQPRIYQLPCEPLLENLFHEMQEIVDKYSADASTKLPKRSDPANPMTAGERQDHQKLYCPQMFAQAIEVLSEAPFADSWEPGQDEGCWLPSNAEYIKVSHGDFVARREQLLRHNVPIKITGVPTENLPTINTFLRHLGASSLPTATISVHECIGPVPNNEYIDAAIKRIQEARAEKKLTLEHPPIKLLNLKCGVLPESVLDPIPDIRFQTMRLLIERVLQAISVGSASMGKQALGLLLGGHPIDLQECIRFFIFATRGQWSGFHVDVVNGTWVFCLAGIKVWSFIPNPTDSEIKEFERYGDDWVPEPGRLKHLVIRPGEMLIMPSGSKIIHCPLTLEDCLMTGGFYIDSRQVLKVTEHVKWLSRHGNCTNEPIEQQFIQAWQQLPQLVRDQPQLFNEVDKSALKRALKDLEIMLGCRKDCDGKRSKQCSPTHCKCKCTAGKAGDCKPPKGSSCRCKGAIDNTDLQDHACTPYCDGPTQQKKTSRVDQSTGKKRSSHDLKEPNQAKKLDSKRAKLS